MFLSLFRKVVSPSYFIVRIPKLTLKWLWLSIIPVSCIWGEFSVRRFLSAALKWKFKIIFVSNCNENFTFKKAWEQFCRNFISYIRKYFELAVINRLQYSMKSVTVAPRSGFPIKDVSEYLFISISFNILLLAVCLIAPPG